MRETIKICMVAALAAMVVVGCSMDSAELGEYVRKEMQEELVKAGGLKALQMKEVRLVKDGEINYSGVGKGELDGHVIKFNVKCRYDGKTVLWDASPSEDSLALLATKERAGEICDRVKAAWPKVKKRIAGKCAVASKKAGEYYDAASKKASECIDAAKEKTAECIDAAKEKTADCIDAAKEKLTEESNNKEKKK